MRTLFRCILLFAVGIPLIATAEETSPEISNFIVQCKANVPATSEEFQKKFSRAWTWLVDQHRQGVIDDVYFPSGDGSPLTYVVSISGGREAVEKLIAGDPLVGEDQRMVACNIQPLGMKLKF